MKYDCNKTLDCMHEYTRMCDSYNECYDGCPLFGRFCNPKNLEQEDIDIIQKWSDEHPKAPKLTKKDRMFLECFEVVADRKISKDPNGCVFYHYDGVSSMLAPDMFKSLEPSTRMTFKELLGLEVEE